MDLRSKTPIFNSSFENEVVEGGNYVEQTVVRTTRSSTIKTTGENEAITNIDHLITSESLKPIKMKKTDKYTRRAKYKTSDYSSEDGDNDFASSNSVKQNQNNEIIEDLRQSTVNGSKSSALDVYRAAGEYWNKYPKTDYTYSPHSRDRIEIAPGIVAMPNMSRKSIRGLDDATEYHSIHKENSTRDSLVQSTVDYSHSHTTSNNISPLRRNLFSATNNYEEKYITSRSSYQKKTTYSRITTFFSSIFTTIFMWSYSTLQVQNSFLIWCAKKVHALTSRLMLLDTWILRATTSRRKLPSVLALCLIPLLLLGGWWLITGLTLYEAYTNTTETTIPLIPLVTNNLHESINHHEDLNPSKLSESQEKTIKITEKIIIEPPTAHEIAAKLTHDQLNLIASSLKNAISLEEEYNSNLIRLILEHPDFKNVINNYNKINLMRTSSEGNELIEQQQILINNLMNEISTMKLELLELEKNQNSKIASLISQIQSENSQSYARILHQVNKCCRWSFIQVESYVAKVLRDLLGAPNYAASQQDISHWLHSVFVAKQDLETQLSNLTHNLKSDFNFIVENNGKVIMDEIVDKISLELNRRLENFQLEVGNGGTVDTLSDAHIKNIVRDALAIYDADKTGLVDYAMEPSGGQILSTRCTENYHSRTAVVSVLGIPLWYPTNNTPRIVITPGVAPGQCWAFQNFPGFLVIKLTGYVKIEAFSLEHVSKKLIPNERIDSAPKQFVVLGLRNETDREPIELGQYIYDYNGPSLQYFAAVTNGLVFDTVELRVLSNHGNPNYTCLYRFRVHGSLSTEPT